MKEEEKSSKRRNLSLKRWFVENWGERERERKKLKNSVVEGLRGKVSTKCQVPSAKCQVASVGRVMIG